MYTEWTKHLSDTKEKEQFEQSILGSRRVLDRLKALLEEREAILDRSELDPKAFDTPNWAEKQAFKNGMRSILHAMKKLIDLDTQIIKENS